MAEEDPSVDRGRRLVWAVAFSLIGSVGLVVVLTRVLAPQLVFQVVLLGLLVFQITRGRAWARWVLVVIAVLNGAAYAHAAATGQEPAWLYGALAAVHFVSAGALGFSPPVGRYLEAQRRQG